MIFDAIKKLFNKDENTVSVLIKMVIKYMKVTIMSLREFLGFLIKLLILEKSSIRRFMNA